MKLTVILNADASGLIGTVRVSEAELRKLGGSLDRTNTSSTAAAGGLRKTASAADSTTRSARGLSTELNTLRGMLATLGVTATVTGIIQAGRAMDRYSVSLAAAVGSQQQGAREMAFLRSEAERLGLYLPTLVQGYTGLAAATRGTNLEGEETRKIFSAVAEAGRAMNLTNDQIAGTMNALQQMAGKGTVSMEELRQQLGDRLPGAMQVAARAMGMSVAQLVKLVSAGELASDEFLPKFAAELSKASAAGVEFAKNSPEAKFNRMKNSLFELGAAISQAGLLEFLADVSDFVGFLADELAGRWPGMIAVWKDSLSSGFRDLAQMLDISIDKADESATSFSDVVDELMILPVSLRTIITILIGEFDKLLISTVEVFKKLWLAGKDSWLALEQSLAPVAGNIKLVFARVIDDILGRLATLVSSAATVAQRLGADETAGKLTKLSASIQSVAVAEDVVRRQIEETTRTLQSRRDEVARQVQQAETAAMRQRDIANDAIQASLDEREAALAKLRATKQAADATAAAGRVQQQATQQTEAQTKAQEALTNATRQWENLLGRVAGSLDPVSKAHEQHNQFVRDATAQAEKLIKLGADEVTVREQLDSAIQASTQRRDEEVTALYTQQRAYEQVLADLDAEAALIQMNERERERHIAAMRAEEAMRRAIAVAQQAGAQLEEEEIERLVELAGARAAMNEATAQAKDAWEDFTGGLADAVLDGSKGVKRWWKAMIDDMKRQLIQSGLLRLFGSLFNTGGASASSGFGQMFSSMFGSGGGLFSSNSWIQAGRNLWSGFSSMFGVAGTGLAGYGVLSGLGGGTQLASGAFAGYLGPGSAGSYGVLAGGTGYGSAAGSGASGASAVGAGVASMAAWFAAAIIANLEMWNRGWRPDGESITLPNGQSVHGGGRGSATDSFASMLGFAGITVTRVAESILGKLGFSEKWSAILSGGSLVTRLFGRKAPELRQAEANYQFGADGFGGNERYFTHEQGGLFRSSRQRWHEFDLSGDMLDAAEQMWEMLRQTMTAGAAALGSEVPASFTAGFRHWQQLSGKTGEVEAEKFIVELMGRTWEEATAELAMTRLNSEALIATIDAALGTTVQRAITGPGTGVGPGTGPGFVGPDIKDPGFHDTIIKATQTVGEAFAIAERWRHDAELLAEGAQFLLAAASDIQRGAGLLGDEGGLTAITDLIEDLSRPGESLVDTYVRVATSTALLDQALALSGVQIEGTREHIVRLATDITTAAGGLERASALWGNYFDRFYTDAERAQFALTQAQASAAKEFGDIGLDYTQFTGEGGTQAFRELFEAVLPTLSAEAIVEWLEAAAALGIVIDATAALNAELGEAAIAVSQTSEQLAAVNDILAGNAWELALAGMTNAEAAIARINQKYDEQRKELLANAATLEQLAELEGQRQQALALQAEAAQRQIDDILGGLQRDIDSLGMSEYEREVANIHKQRADYIAALVETGMSLADATIATRAWRDAMLEAAEAAEAARQQRLLDRRSDILGGLQRDIDSLGMSEYEREVANIHKQRADYIAALVETGMSLADATIATRAWRDAMLEAAEAAEAARQQRLLDRRSDILGGLQRDIDSLGMSEYEREVANIHKQRADYIAALVETGMSLADATIATRAWRDAMLEAAEAAEAARQQRLLDRRSDILGGLQTDIDRLGMTDYEIAVADVHAKRQDHIAALVDTGMSLADATIATREWRDAMLESVRAAEQARILKPLADDLKSMRQQLDDFGLSDYARRQAQIARETQDALAAAQAAGATAAELMTISLNGAERAMLAAALAAKGFTAELEGWEFEESLIGLSESEAQLARIKKTWEERYLQAVEIFGEGSEEAIRVLGLWDRAVGRFTAEAQGATEEIAQAARVLVDMGAILDGIKTWAEKLNESIAHLQPGAEMERWISELSGLPTLAQQAVRRPLAEVVALVRDEYLAKAAELQQQLDFAVARLEALPWNAQAEMHTLEGQIRALEQAMGSITGQMGNALETLKRMYIASLQGVRDYLDSMLLGDLSALTPAERIAEAWDQLTAAVEAGEGDAATRLADTYLRLLREYEASGEDYNAGFYAVRDLLESMFDIDWDALLGPDAATDSDNLAHMAGTVDAQLAAAQVANDWLAQIAANTSGGWGLPSYDVGTYNVPATGPAILHAGEMVLPRPMADAMRRGAFGGGDTQALEIRLDAVIARLDRIDRTTAQGAQAVSQAIVTTGATSDRNADASRARHAQAQRRGVTA